MPSINSDALPSRIRITVARDRDGLRVARTLAQGDVDLIVGTARGQRAPSALSRPRAIGMLADAVPPAVAMPVLTEIARNRSETRSNRVTAIRALGQVAALEAQLAVPEARATLVQTLLDPDPRVLQETLSALGQSGDPSVLPALNAVPAPSDAAARRQLALAKAVIAYRAGLPEADLEAAPRSPRRPVDTAPSRLVAIEVLSAEQTANDLTRFQGPDFGLRFSERAYRVRCGRKEWTLFVNAEVGSLAAAERLHSRPNLAGLLARWLPPDAATATQLLLLTRPEGGSIRFDFVRTDGEVIYTGSGAPSDSGVSFDIGDVERPGSAPTLLVGLVTEGGVRLDTARVSESRVSPRRVEPVRIQP